MGEAKKEGVSLNQLCVNKLSKPLAWYAELTASGKLALASGRTKSCNWNLSKKIPEIRVSRA